MSLQVGKRIAVIGSPGSGKSTLARRLGEPLGLPVIHLDAHFWSAGWVEADSAQWPETVRGLAAGEQWIIDGNYSSTMELRLPRAETIIYLDFPRWLCLLRVVRRWLAYHGDTRPDLPDGCPEKIDFEFLRWVWDYPRRSRPHTLALLQSLQHEKQIIRLQSPGAVSVFLELAGRSSGARYRANPAAAAGSRSGESGRH